MSGGDAAPINFLLQTLINVCKEEISLIQGLEKDADHLMKTLSSIQGYLNDAGNKVITDDAVKNWLNGLEDMAFDADNVLDELHYDQLSKETKAIETEKKKVPSCFTCFNHYKRRRQMASRIREINKKFKETRKMASDLGLERKLEEAHAAPDAGPETTSLSFDPIFIGRDNDVSNIVEMLTITNDEVLSILPIFGMGGMGKTTVTRNVFNHEKIKTHFRKHIWVHVSANFDPVILLKKILAEVASSENDKFRSKEGVLKQLQEALKGKTNLLVLDDVWNQDRQKWEDFINSWLGITSAKGNRIIVTTRHKEVASIVRTLPIYEIEGLPEDSCWSIIKEKAFGKGDVSSRFETFGRNIAKKCHGLPLAANVVGGVLRDKSEDDWRSIEDKWLSDFKKDEESILKILKFSFDNLSSPSLKKCFAYCSIFPKGDRIIKEELIELWMAEGFLQIDQKNDMEIVGNKFLEFLQQNSLLQVRWRGFHGNILSFGMHDLVHDLACLVSNSVHQVRYMGRENDGDESSSLKKDRVQFLRTLFFKGEISTIMFSDFKSLRVLVLINYDLEELPSSIRELIHLRYLDISFTKIKYLPDSIGELYHLQTLRAYTRLKKLPNTLIYLISLRHLHLHDSTRLPPNIGGLTSLQTLKHFGVANEDGCRISEVGSLVNLKGDLHIFNLEKVHDKEEADRAYLFRKPNVVKLVLRWNEFKEREISDENVLEGLQPHSNLKWLEIFGFNGTKFPLWTMKMIGLDNLMELSLQDCRECKEIPMLGHLPLLSYLKLSKLRNVKVLDWSFYNIENCRSNDATYKDAIIVFPALRNLVLSDMSNLTEWVDLGLPNAAENQLREVKVFPCLQYLEISRCQRLRSVPSQLSSLKKFYIRYCEGLINFPNLCNLSSLDELEIWGCPKLKSIPYSSAGQTQGLTSLHKLSICDCEGLINFPDLLSFSALEELEIDECPNLKSIPYSSAGQSQSFTSLRKLSLWNCEGLIDLPDLLNFNSLEELEIDRCPNLKSIPCSSAGQLQGLTLLLKLQISNCEGLIDLPDLHIFNSLEMLVIKRCPNIKLLPYSSAGPQGLTSLCELQISKCEGLSNLPDLCNLISLEKLVIEGCPNLKLIPYSKVGQSRGLTLLRELSIQDCEGLINLPYEMVESCLSTIEVLWLENLSSIMNMTIIINFLHKMLCLETLGIVNVPIIMTRSPAEIGSLRRLKSLTIGPPSSSLDYVYFNEAIDGIFQLGRQSICSLCLSGMEDWVSLPDGLQHLIAFSELKLKNFGIEKLPEWFGNLTSLKTLKLSYCKNLRCLPSMEAMRRLTKLTELVIEDCPALKERCIDKRSDEHDSEWPKISHILSIWVDNRRIRQ